MAGRAGRFLVFRLFALAWVALASLVFGGASPAVDADKTFAQFWAAASPQQALAAGDVVARSGMSFDDAFARLRRGRMYSADVQRGVVRLNHRLGVSNFAYQVEVPANYDAARSY